MTEQQVQMMIHNLLPALLLMVVAGVILNFIRGVFFLRRAVQRKDYDMALAVLLVLYAVVLMYIPQDYFLWNYLAIGWGVLLFAVIFKIYFGEVIMKGTLAQRIMMVAGILIILAALLLGKYFPAPEWLDYIPSI